VNKLAGVHQAAVSMGRPFSKSVGKASLAGLNRLGRFYIWILGHYIPWTHTQRRIQVFPIKRLGANTCSFRLGSHNAAPAGSPTLARTKSRRKIHHGTHISTYTKRVDGYVALRSVARSRCDCGTNVRQNSSIGPQNLYDEKRGSFGSEWDGAFFDGLAWCVRS